MNELSSKSKIAVALHFGPQAVELVKNAYELAKQFKLRGVPTTVFINQKGQEFARVLGDIDFNDKNFIKWLNSFNK